MKAHAGPPPKAARPSVAVGIDLGGTNLKAAAVDDRGRILHKQSVPTEAERGPDPIIADTVTLTDTVLKNASLTRNDVVGVGVGSPGPLSPRTGRIFKCANLPGWSDVPLRDRLSERLGLPVILDNDANAAALGESWVGAGRDGGDLVLLTLGTGVGAGVILNGSIFHGHFENAAELGHMIVAVDGLPCGCGQRGCLEQYASAEAIVRRVRAALENGTPSTLNSQVGTGWSLNTEIIVDAVHRGDELGRRVWTEACTYLAVACINIQHAFNPQRIVLGGGLALAGNLLLDEVRAEFTRRQWTLYNDFPEIVLSELDADAGVIGAAAMAHRLEPIP